MKKILTPFLSVAALMTTGSVLAASFADVDLPIPEKKENPIYIVHLSGDPVFNYEGGIPGLAATKPEAGEKVNKNDENVLAYQQRLESIHDDLLRSVGATTQDKVYSYTFGANGFAARLNEDQVAALNHSSAVINVFNDEVRQLQTTTSHQFIGVSGKGQAWANGFTGEDVVIGVIDSGINPEHPSFADVETPLYGSSGPLKPYGKPPASFSGSKCDFGNTAYNPNDLPFECNNKLVSATYFAAGGTVGDTGYLSARDSGGHGTHVAGIAGGNWGVPAYVNGEYAGDVSGIAPRARIAAYKVCWDNGCWASDTMAALDQAMSDGVDVINYSVGGPSTSFGSIDSIFFLYAAHSGIFVATSQGNSGPAPGTTGTPAGVPWITSVAATQDDQVFSTAVALTAPLELVGELTAIEGDGSVKLADVGSISANLVPAEPIFGCSELTNPEAITGNIAVVARGECGFLSKFQAAQAAGARAIVVFNDGRGPDRVDPFGMGGFDGSETIPGVAIGFRDGIDMLSAVADGETITGSLSPDIQVSQVDRVAGFSSRGPNGGAPDIIKPDIAAPGVQIMAGVAGVPGNAATFDNYSGTSMASPHVAGLFALLKQAHPEWTPAMARSALMTTARNNLKKTFGEDVADPFDIGAGFVVPSDAFEPGLVYDAGLLDYLAFTCETNDKIVEWQTCVALDFYGYSKDPTKLNLPSVAVSQLAGVKVIKRTVTSVAEGTKTFTVTKEEPEGVEMYIWPNALTLAPGESATYNVAFITTDDAVLDEWTFGSLTWSHSDTHVRSPIAVKPVSVKTPASLFGKGTDNDRRFVITPGFDGELGVSFDGLVEGNFLSNEIEDGGLVVEYVDVPEGTTFSRFAIYNSEVGHGYGGNNLNISVYYDNPFIGWEFKGQSQNLDSDEDVDVLNPGPGRYAVVVEDMISAEGPTAYNLYNFNLDGSNKNNMASSSPSVVTKGVAEFVTVSWSGLTPATRYLGKVSFFDVEGSSFQSTVFDINTQ